MRDLPPAVRLLGQPVLASALTGGLALSFLALLQAGPGGACAALGLLLPAAWVMRAAEAVQRQRQWKQAWDSMLPAPPSPKGPWQAIVCLAVVAGLLLWHGAGL